MKHFGLIGYPLNHSFSGTYFNKKFVNEGIAATYSNFELPTIDDFHKLIQNHSLSGLNVTAPYKESVIPFLTYLDNDAREIGAVNTILIQNNITTGFNTDAEGFRQSLVRLIDQEKVKALILGTGGSAKAVAWVLKKQEIPFKFVSRQIRNQHFTYSDIDSKVMEEFHLIINCTPLGRYPDKESPPLPYHLLHKNHLLYDLNYNPEITCFLEKGLQHGCSIKNGLEMLYLQAEYSWSVWTTGEI
jgi:shikimate dehydrogenase